MRNSTPSHDGQHLANNCVGRGPGSFGTSDQSIRERQPMPKSRSANDLQTFRYVKSQQSNNLALTCHNDSLEWPRLTNPPPRPFLRFSSSSRHGSAGRPHGRKSKHSQDLAHCDAALAAKSRAYAGPSTFEKCWFHLLPNCLERNELWNQPEIYCENEQRRARQLPGGVESKGALRCGKQTGMFDLVSDKETTPVSTSRPPGGDNPNPNGAKCVSVSTDSDAPEFSFAGAGQQLA
ncbi:hypothetical protein E4U43_001398 [Claviceps pusilla]|uniref:Uncharacterized protein n=1 Tax=Claviceps pusilla TaxID=123648 RepID=A0A9P7N8K6_9HYPO|nr:hypothetical protein E4U43_001398 [Claviceps pusilla]